MTTTHTAPLKRPHTPTALISVSDKSGLCELGAGLINLGFRLVSTGQSAMTLADGQLPVQTVESLTGWPEMLEGRVKTLHPAVHGGILARRHRSDDLKTLSDLGLGTIDVVVVNLYPFIDRMQSGADDETLHDSIDIGGVTLMRAAAKNHDDVLVCTSPADYTTALELLRKEQMSGVTEATRRMRRTFAAQALRLTSAYDDAIARYLTGEETSAATDLFPDRLHLEARRVTTLRYGENPHQQAAYYRFDDVSTLCLATATQRGGQALSYNNIQDANAAIEMASAFDRPCCVAVKHKNPCGVAIADTLEEAWTRAHASDPISIFGGIVAFNREVTLPIARALHALFLEVIVAPAFTPDALALLAAKPRLRLLTLPMTDKVPRQTRSIVSVLDGLLVQTRDTGITDRTQCHPMGAVAPQDGDWDDLLFAWTLVKYVQSNAVVLVRDGATVGIGAGQQNRVGAVKIALAQAGDRARGAVLASDAFFPMPDSVQCAIDAGVRAIIQPGGSRRDDDSIAVCDRAHIPMVATGQRHFKH